MAPSASNTHSKTRSRAIVIGCLVVLLSLAVLVYRSGAVVCTPSGTTTAILQLCQPASGETGWTTAINNNWGIIDNLFNPTTGFLKAQYGGWPTGAIIMIDSGTCPTGFTEVTALRGRYAVGVPSGGTMAATVGTALTSTENRPAGAHTH